MSTRVLADVTSSSGFEELSDGFDLRAWLDDLTTDEFRRCSPETHIAFGVESGTGRLLAVERIAGTLAVHHYEVRAASEGALSLASETDLFGPQGRTTTLETWSLALNRDAEGRISLVNRIVVEATDDFLTFMNAFSVTFDEASRDRQRAVTAHVETETPFISQSLLRSIRPR